MLAARPSSAFPLFDYGSVSCVWLCRPRHKQCVNPFSCHRPVRRHVTGIGSYGGARGATNSRCVWVLDLYPMPGAAGAVGRVSVFSAQTFIVILDRHSCENCFFIPVGRRGHQTSRTRRQSFALAEASLFPVNGWVSSQSARAAASGSIPVFFHHELSSRQ